MAKVVVNKVGNVDQKAYAEIQQAAKAYENALNNGTIGKDKNHTVTINVGNFGFSANAETRGTTIDIDVDSSRSGNTATSYQSTAVHELTHAYNPTLHRTGYKDQNAVHSAEFYEKVDVDARQIGIDPKKSGTKHPNYDPDLIHVDKGGDSSKLPERPEAPSKNDGGKGGNNNSTKEDSVGNDGGKGGGGSSSNDNDNDNSGGGSNSSGKPIVVDLDGDGVETVSLDESTASFDFDDDGYREKTAWVGKDDGLLMFDVGNDGVITEAKEIAFAYWTEDENDTDLEGLRTTFDTNGDGVLNSDDEDWNGFRIWNDANQNGTVEEGELLTLDEAGLVEFDLEHKEGTAEVDVDGTVNHGLIDITKSDGTVVEGGDIAFAYETLGVKEVVDENGNVTLDYEGDTLELVDPGEGFSVADQEAMIARIASMGFTGDAQDAMQYAIQNGDDVVFQFDGESVLTIEDTTIQNITDGLEAA